VIPDPPLLRKGVDACVFYCEVAGDGFDFGLAGILVLWPAINLQAWATIVAQMLNETLNYRSVRRDSLHRQHFQRFRDPQDVPATLRSRPCRRCLSHP
jgi:hypothetical protein